jgi:hypothetical protein
MYTETSSYKDEYNGSVLSIFMRLMKSSEYSARALIRHADRKLIVSFEAFVFENKNP